MRTLPIVRATYLNLYLDALRAIGAPVDRSLARVGLPGAIESMPDAYVSIALALEAVARCGSDMTLMELGYYGSRRLSLGSFSTPMQLSLLLNPTLHARLQSMATWVVREDNISVALIESAGEHTRVALDMPQFTADPFASLGEWIKVHGIISIVRSVAGPTWMPPEITFTSRMAPSMTAQDSFARTRFLSGQPHTSVSVETALLSLPCPPLPISGEAPSGSASCDDPADWTFLAVLSAVIQPYLSDRRLDLDAAAELLGTSGRTLQRRLKVLGTNYLTVIDEARGDLMRQLLGDPSRKIIDVALTCGYDSPQNFSRAFARIHGMTPTAFRRHHAAA